MPQPEMPEKTPLLSTDQKTKGQIKSGLQQTPRRGKSAVGRPVRTPGCGALCRENSSLQTACVLCATPARDCPARGARRQKRSDCPAQTLSEKRNAAAGISGRAEEKAAAFPVVLGKNSGVPRRTEKKAAFRAGARKISGGLRRFRRTAGCVSVRTEKRRPAAQRASGFCAAGRG